MLNRVSDEGKPKEIADYGDRYRGCLQGKEQVRPNLVKIAAAAIVRLMTEIHAGGGPEIEFCDDIPIDELPSELQTVVFPVVLELMMNACRHSRSETVLVGLTQDDKQVCIQVQDWGVGFEPASTGRGKRGLKGVRDLVRGLGGTVEIESLRGAGACVIVEIPLSRETVDPHITQPRPEPK